MPAIETQNSWLAQLEEEEERQVDVTGNTKMVTSYEHVNGIKKKVVRHYRIEKVMVTPAAAARKAWKKFGDAKDALPGPESSTTVISHDEIKMEFIRDEDEDTEQQAPVDSLLPQMNNAVVTCRNCGLGHWTLQCPYKNEFNALNKLNEVEDKDDKTGLKKPGPFGSSSRPGGLPGRKEENTNTIRVTNLPEETQDSDIRDLFKDFGRILRIFLAKDKITGNSKGFAFVSFETREQAIGAIRGVNGHGYNNLILSVEWAKPSAN